MKNKDFYRLIMDHAAKDPQHAFLTVEKESITYGEFVEKVQKIAAGLTAIGVKKDSKVGLVLHNSIAWYELFWGAIYLGAQPVPMDPQSGEYELRHLFKFTDVSVCFLDVTYRGNNIYESTKVVAEEMPEVKQYIVCQHTEDSMPAKFMGIEEFTALAERTEATYCEVEEDRIMSLACTSGSTGNPKILTVPYVGFYDAIVDMGDYLKFTNEDVMMIGMPLYHQGGFGMGLQMVVKGGSVIYQPQFDPTNFLKTVQEKKVSVIQLTATLAKILLSHPQFEEYDLSSVKVCYFAGEVLPRSIAETFVEKLHIRVINVIGSSETATMVVWDSKYDYDVDPSDFRELPFTKATLVDEDGNEVADKGELRIRTTAVIYNYHNNEEATNAAVVTVDGVREFRTGDMAMRLPDGRIRFLGRVKRVIKRGANLVHAEEVEGFLLTHPKVAAIAVVAKKHEVFGEQIVAYVQTKDKEALTRGEVAKFCRGRLSAYKIPDQVITTEEVPHDIGKVQFKYIKKDA